MNKKILTEYVNAKTANLVVESVDDKHGTKQLYMKGICIEGDRENANGRIYSRHEIHKAVNTMNEIIAEHGGILGEADHPEDLKINLDRVSHMIEKMWMEDSYGYGKLKILPTPMGQLVKTMLDNSVKLGVSSRGSGNVNEANGQVSDFEIVTVDVVAQPSAPNAYPQAVYESLFNQKFGHRVFEMAGDAVHDEKVQKHLSLAVRKLINDLKLK